MPDKRLKDLFGEPDSKKTLSSLFGSPDKGKVPQAPQEKKRFEPEEVRIKGEFPYMGIPKMEQMPNDLTKEEFAEIQPLLKAFEKLPPGSKESQSILQELLNYRDIFKAQRIEEDLIKKARLERGDLTAGEKIGTGVVTGVGSGLTAGHFDIFLEVQKSLDKLSKDPWLSPEYRKSLDNMAKSNIRQVSELQSSAAFQWGNLAGHLIGMAAPFSVMNKATAFLKLGKYVPNLSKSAGAFIKISEGVLKEAAMGATYGGVRKLEEGESRWEAMAEDAMLFGMFGGIFGLPYEMKSIFKHPVKMIKNWKKVLEGSKNMDDFYKKVVNDLSKHQVGEGAVSSKAAADRLVYLRENYGTIEKPLRFITEDGSVQSYSMGNSFWYSNATKKAYEKMADDLIKASTYVGKEGGVREFPGLDRLMKEELEATGLNLVRGKQPLTKTLSVQKNVRTREELAKKLGGERVPQRKLTQKERLAEQQVMDKKSSGKTLGEILNEQAKKKKELDVKILERGRQEFKKAWENAGLREGDSEKNMELIQQAIKENPDAVPQVYVKAEGGEIVTMKAFNHSDLIQKAGMKHSEVIDSGWKVGDDYYSYFYGKIEKPKPKEIKFAERGSFKGTIPVFNMSTNTIEAQKVGAKFKNNEIAINELERQMIRWRDRAKIFNENISKSKDLNVFTRAQAAIHRSAMYREAWEVATGRMPEQIDDITKFFSKRKTFLNSLDEIAARASQRRKLRWDEQARKFYGGLPVDPVFIASDLTDLAIIGAQRIFRGADNFAKFSKQMVDEFGDKIKPHLEKIYKKAQANLKRYMKAAEDKVHELPSLKKALEHYKKGEYAAEWYNKTRPEMVKFFGNEKDADMFIDFVAITSPQTTPKANVTKAYELFKRWKLGQTSDDYIYGTEDQWKFFKAAIEGKPFGGLKINDFRANLKGDLDRVTVDMWMLEIYFNKTSGTPGQYKFIAEDVKRLAKQLNKKPAEVQAAMWVGYKELPQFLGKRGAAGTYNTIEFYVKQRFAASASKTPTAYLLEQLESAIARDPQIKGAKVELGSKNFVLGLFRAGAKDIKNTELGITASPYKHMEKFLKENKLVLSDQEKETIKNFMKSIAERKLLTEEQRVSEIKSFISNQFGEKFKVQKVVREQTARELSPTTPDTRKWYIRWLDGETLKDLNVASTLRKAMGKRKRYAQNAVEHSNERRDWFNKQSDEYNIAFMDQYERGELRDIADPKIREIAKDYKERLDRAWANSFVSAEGKAAYIEDYFPHIWEDPQGAKKFFSGLYGGKLSKNPSFLKKRHFDLIQDGLDAGFKLKTTNPELLVLERELAGFRFEEAKTVLNELQRDGYLRLVKPNERAPVGWVPLTKSRSLEVITPRGKVGEYYVPELARGVLDNYLSKGMWTLGETPFQKVFNKGLRGIAMAKNATVALKLGFSGFHFVETSTSNHVYNFSRALQKLAQRDLRGMISALGDWLPVVGDVRTARKGGDIYRAWITGKFKNNYEKWAVEQIELAGGSLKMPYDYRRGVDDMFQRAKQSWKKGKVFKAAGQLPLAVVEAFMKPLMDMYIPRLKAYNYISMVEDFAKRNPNVVPNSKEWEKAVQKLWDSVDNRFGQLQYDNLFWNRYVRDIGVVSQISMGWGLGTFREFGGGAIDMTKVAVGAILKHKPNVLIDRPLYSAIYAAHFAAMGGMMTYLMSGEYPETLLDFFYPKTGNKNQDGTAERVQMPTMLKEIPAISEALRKKGVLSSNPFEVVSGIPQAALTYGGHKLAPVFSGVYDMIRNKNFYDIEIRDPDAPIHVQSQQLAEYMFDQFVTPISISSFTRHIKRTGGRKVPERILPQEMVDYVLPFMGFSVAAGYITKTPIQSKIFDAYDRYVPKGSPSRAEWDKYQMKAKVKELLWKGDAKAAYIEFLKLKKAGIIPARTKFDAFAKTSMTPRDMRAFSRLPKPVQDRLWKQMNKEEMLKYFKHYHRTKNMRIFIPKQ